MRLVGLTGGIATGKSTVSSLLRQTGLPVIDCDEIAREVVRQGRWGWRRVVKAFGENILLENGEVNRELLGRLIFKDSRSRAKLNAATHLPVFVELAKKIVISWANCETALVIDMPLLFETRANRWFYPTVLVWSDEETQLERLMSRDNCNEDEGRLKIASQMPLVEKSELCSVLINNSGPLTSTKIEVNALALELRRRQLGSYLVCPIAIGMYTMVIVWLIGTML